MSFSGKSYTGITGHEKWPSLNFQHSCAVEAGLPDFHKITMAVYFHKKIVSEMDEYWNCRKYIVKIQIEFLKVFFIFHETLNYHSRK